MTQGSSQNRLRRFTKQHIVLHADRIINLISLLVGTLSFVLAIIVWRTPEPPPDYIYARDLTIFGTMWIANIFLIYRYAIRITSLDRARNYLTRYHHSAQNMLDNYKGEMFKYFFNTIHIEGPIDIDDHENDLFGKVCFVITSETRNALKDYFNSRGIEIGEDVAVTVKLIVNSSSVVKSPDIDEEKKKKILSKPYWVTTAYRDPYTHANHKKVRRVAEDQIYDIEANSAFDDIYKRGEPYFMENNLKQMGSHYHNENAHWSEQYNATLVVPIRYANGSGDKSVCFGFLAADSMNKDSDELYDDGCLKILHHAADLLCSFFLSLYLYNHQPSGSTSLALNPPSASSSVLNNPPVIAPGGRPGAPSA